MTTLGELARSAGPALLATAPFDPSRAVTGVHVSELTDPGRYLDGGELLLTTGIPLTGGEEDASYVGRLAANGVGALGLGLGEGWQAPPRGFAELCAAAGVALFVVPDGQPFLSVTRAFWQIESRIERDAVVRAAHAHTRLAQAAADDDAVPTLVRLVAQAVGGWAAWIPLDVGAPEGMLHPANLNGLLPTVTSDVRRSLQRSGAAAASFVAHGSVVVAHPVAAHGRTIGALAVGAGRPLARADRQLTLTAVALLRLVATPRLPQSDGAGLWVAALALDGDATSARALARTADIDLPLLLRVLVTAGGARADENRLTVDRDGLRLTLLPGDDDRAVRSGAMSAAVPIEEIPAAAARTIRLWRSNDSDGLVTEPDDHVQGWIDALAVATPPLLDTVRAHLRGGQRVEHTARALGVHRNTVRQRLATAAHVLGMELSDPDVAAQLWLGLRRGTR